MDFKSIFGPRGTLARHHPHYEYRPSQATMAEAVDAAIHGPHHLCVEAGTGIGKSIAYLLPAIGTHKRTIISTATRALQEQLFFKDIPLLRQIAGAEIKAIYMKGRNNYLCLKKLETHLQNPELLPGDRGEQIDAIGDWAQKTATGDRAELDFLRDDDPVWRQLDARRETCLGQKCSHFEACYITRLRQDALASDLIVVNHALFFADLALRRQGTAGVLPDYATVIFDEAHEIEDVATSFFGRQVSSYRFEDFERDVIRSFQKHPAILRYSPKLFEAARWFFDLFAVFHNDQRQSIGLLARRPDFIRLAAAVDELLQLFISMAGKLGSRDDEQDALLDRAQELRSDFSFISSAADPAYVYWIDKRHRGVFLNASPIDLAPILTECLFSKTHSVILTSATLTAGGSFRYLRERLGITQSEELVLESEYDLNAQAVLYIPPLPDPRQVQFVETACEAIEQLLEISEGRAFLLFTSFAQMEKCYDRLAPLLRFPLLKQGDFPKKVLLERFRQTPSSVLFATASFWQGVDVQGDALSCVVIDKLPFAVPTDPIVSARYRLLEQQGRNAFEEYSVPQAVILLKQGLGRLIRSKQDRGILSILDNRILTKSYGRHFLESLPKCPLTDNIENLRNFFDIK
ncbi:MAG TPA: ATP-dependent DNA helicase [Acidobacteriota bacterium]|jgi:ATP-dependent DNA helicase DinG